jgi:hypothetical protein
MKALAALVIGLVGFGCSSAVAPSSGSASSEPAVSTSRSLLGTLRTRDREVLLYASPSGMKVTVKATNGALIADRIDLDDLRRLDPHIYQLCRSGVASGGTYLDATLDTRMRSTESRQERNETPTRSHP